MIHTPVLVNEVLEFFRPKPGDTLLDATIGHGGHAQVFLEAAPDTKVVGLDADAAALAVARETLAKYQNRVTLLHANFASLEDVLKERGKFSHILFDLGVGSHQLADDQRSFSFTSTGPLAMKFGAGGGEEDVAALLVRLSERDLANIIREYGEERFAGRIARAIKASLPIKSGQELARVIADAVPRASHRIHPATRTFQALRIAVNQELESLQKALPQALEVAQVGGVLAVISFHSLEDRIVKKFLHDRKSTLEILTKKPIRAGQEEVNKNPRSRSAKLRSAKIKTKQTHDNKHSPKRNSPPSPWSQV